MFSVLDYNMKEIETTSSLSIIYKNAYRNQSVPFVEAASSRWTLLELLWYWEPPSPTFWDGTSVLGQLSLCEMSSLYWVRGFLLVTSIHWSRFYSGIAFGHRVTALCADISLSIFSVCGRSWGPQHSPKWPVIKGCGASTMDWGQWPCNRCAWGEGRGCLRHLLGGVAVELVLGKRWEEPGRRRCWERARPRELGFILGLPTQKIPYQWGLLQRWGVCQWLQPWLGESFQIKWKLRCGCDCACILQCWWWVVSCWQFADIGAPLNLLGSMSLSASSLPPVVQSLVMSDSLQLHEL